MSRAPLLLAALLLGPGGATARAEEARAEDARKPGGFDPTLVDPSADPCQDFFRFACGTWIKANTIPPEYASWGRFDELTERNRGELRRILEKAARPDPRRTEVEQKIGDYYAACMDEGRADEEGLRPLSLDLERLAALTDAASVVVEAGRLKRRGGSALFTFDSTLDARNATEVIAEAHQGGLGLPDRDYYLREDDASKQLREQYRAHVARMFVLAGDTGEAAAAEAARVVSIETALAKGSLTRVERRNPEKQYNRKSLAELEVLAPSIPWERYFLEVGLARPGSINVGAPAYFVALDEQLRTAPIGDWKSYLRWHLLHDAAPRLSSALVDENFAFFGRTLTGAKARQPQWRRCVAAADSNLKDLLGQPYVEATFGADGKKRMEAMVAALEGAMDADLAKVPWMDDATRAKAKEKLKAFARKIGYPDRWVDFGKLRIVRTSWHMNATRAMSFAFDREMARIGKPFDKKEWFVTVPTVDAQYAAGLNDITFPAGILQPPFFDKSMDDAVNFGAIGAVIGHEITHGFDDQGSQYDKDGNLRNWWTEKAAAEFKKRTSCVEKQFSEYSGVDGQKLNGALTLGENVADLGGLKIALSALDRTGGADVPKRDGLSRDQRFFLGWAQIWCEDARPEQRRVLLNVDPHVPPRDRVNGPLSNMKEFKAAFSCPDEAPMVRKVAEVCAVW
jgi:putative endopeptidase